MSRPRTKVEQALDALPPRRELRVARLQCFPPYCRAFDRLTLESIGWFDLSVPGAIQALQETLLARGYAAPQIQPLKCGSPFDGNLTIL